MEKGSDLSMDYNQMTADEITAQFLVSCEAGDWDEVAAILFHHGILIWFWVAPQQLAPVVATFPPDLIERSEIARFLEAALGLPTAPLKFAHSETPLPENPTQEEVFSFALSAGNLRLTGRQADSLQVMVILVGLTGTKSGSLIDQSNTRSGMLFLQAGLTALLAGDMVRSEAWFGRIASAEVDTHLPFMVRDALSKLALTYLLWSERDMAARALEAVSAYPPTASWVEYWLTSSIELSLLALNDPDKFAEQVTDPNFDWPHIGEAWPIVLWLALRHLVTSGRASEAVRLIDRVEVLAMPASGGDGLPGSVLCLWRANVMVVNGDYNKAADTLKLADSNLLEVQLAYARLEYLTGKTKQALGRLIEMPTAISYFGQTRLEHALLVAACYLRLGDTFEAEKALRAALRADTSAADLAAAMPPASVLSYAQSNWAGDQELESVDWNSCLFSLTEHDPTVDLSSRELEVLRLLVTELSREDVAGKLHVSENTLKSHVRSIYRKLGVRTRREAAVIAAQYLRGVDSGG